MKRLASFSDGFGLGVWIGGGWTALRGVSGEELPFHGRSKKKNAPGPSLSLSLLAPAKGSRSFYFCKEKERKARLEKSGMEPELSDVPKLNL